MQEVTDMLQAARCMRDFCLSRDTANMRLQQSCAGYHYAKLDPHRRSQPAEECSPATLTSPPAAVATLADPSADPMSTPQPQADRFDYSPREYSPAAAALHFQQPQHLTPQQRSKHIMVSSSTPSRGMPLRRPRLTQSWAHARLNPTACETMPRSGR